MIFSLGILLKSFGMDEYSGWNVDGYGDGQEALSGDGEGYGYGYGNGDGYGDGDGYVYGNGDGWSYSIKEFR